MDDTNVGRKSSTIVTGEGEGARRALIISFKSKAMRNVAVREPSSVGECFVVPSDFVFVI